MADLLSKPLEVPASPEQPKPPVTEVSGADIGIVEKKLEHPESERIDGSEHQDELREEPEAVHAEPVVSPRRAPVHVVAPTKDPVLQRIEDILSEDMTDTFLKLPPDKQRQFKEVGEQTAGLIKQMIESAKVNTKKIFDLIRKWLKLVPGINQFFLEQEAKIKTDKILSLKP